jgi:hypothetical protein
MKIKLELTPDQVRYLLDIMWGCEPELKLASRHGISDVYLERYLSSSLQEKDT